MVTNAGQQGRLEHHRASEDEVQEGDRGRCLFHAELAAPGPRSNPERAARGTASAPTPAQPNSVVASAVGTPVLASAERISADHRRGARTGPRRPETRLLGAGFRPTISKRGTGFGPATLSLGNQPGAAWIGRLHSNRAKRHPLGTAGVRSSPVVTAAQLARSTDAAERPRARGCSPTREQPAQVILGRHLARLDRDYGLRSPVVANRISRRGTMLRPQITR